MAPESITLYGIANCDTVRKARAWLAGQGVAVRFHDLRRDGMGAVEIDRWAAEVGWELLLNRKGRTWRDLPESERAAVHDAASACRLMASQPSLIRRPVVQWPRGLTVGFNPADWQAHLGDPDLLDFFEPFIPIRQPGCDEGDCAA